MTEEVKQASIRRLMAAVGIDELTARESLEAAWGDGPGDVMVGYGPDGKPIGREPSYLVRGQARAA